MADISWLEVSVSADGFESAVQKAVYNALIASLDVTERVRGIYDAQPRPLTGNDALLFPYITIGEDTLNDWSTDTESGADATITIHTWSRYKGRAELKSIQAAIYLALHRATLVVEGFQFVSIDWLGSDSMTDADGETRHGVQTFRIILEQA